MSAYRVLVVDDNHEVRRMVTSSIKTLGAEIDVLDVPSAEEALFISASLPLDLVVLDFRLPGMSGLDMLARLRKRRPETKIILVTGVNDAAIHQQVSEAGVEAFFFKPIEINQFLNAVKRCLWPVQIAPASPQVVEPAAPQPPFIPPKETETIKGEVSQPVLQGIRPTLDERLNTLKQQLRAVSVLLVDDAGQVLEVAGNPSMLTTGSTTLSALLNAYKGCLQVSQALGWVTGTSMQYFASQRQCLFIAPVGLNHALFAYLSGLVESNRLGSVDRYIQSAVRDLQVILASIAAEERLQQEKLESLKQQLPGEVIVDQQTLEKVEQLFNRAAKNGGKEGADHFWDTVGENESPENAHSKDTLSYDQARDLGLAPDEDKPS